MSAYGKIEHIEIKFEEYADCVRAEAEITMAERIEEKRLRTQEKERENADGI